MANALLDGVPFRVDPYTVQGAFKVKTSVTRTIGGKVVQVFGTRCENIMLSGSFGIGGHEEQTIFLERMIRIGEAQIGLAVPGQPRKDARTIRFQWPLRRWDFMVYLAGFHSTDGPSSVHWSNKTIAPGWSLDLMVIEDNGQLTRAAEDAYIARLANGLHWKQTEFNGPMNDLNTVGRGEISVPPPTFGGAGIGKRPDGRPTGSVQGTGANPQSPSDPIISGGGGPGH